MSQEPLSDRGQKCLATRHLQRAQELEVSLTEYAHSFDLGVKDLYSAKRALVREGFGPTDRQRRRSTVLCRGPSCPFT